jgi:hypothetical protein
MLIDGRPVLMIQGHRDEHIVQFEDVDDEQTSRINDDEWHSVNACTATLTSTSCRYRSSNRLDVCKCASMDAASKPNVHHVPSASPANVCMSVDCCHDYAKSTMRCVGHVWANGACLTDNSQPDRMHTQVYDQRNVYRSDSIFEDGRAVCAYGQCTVCTQRICHVR